MAPEPLQRTILKQCYDKTEAGHMRMNKTTERVKRYAIWYKMMDSCLVYVRNCSVYNRQHKPQNKPKPHQATHPKVLGLTLDPKLTYSTHIHNISVHAHKPLQVIKALTVTGWGKQKETLMTPYKAVMRPALECASSI